MPEREPVLPYNTTFFANWCNQQGMDCAQYNVLDENDFRIANLHAPEQSLTQQLRREIELSLPLEGCERVDDPRVKPDERMTPKVYKAPEGAAFKLTARFEYPEVDEWGDEISGTMRVHEATFVGEYLDIETRLIRGEPHGSVDVIEQPRFSAVPAWNPGSTMAGPDLSEAIRLPSRHDPEKDGAYLIFSRLEGWEVVRSGEHLRADYDKTTVELVPFHREVDTELYIADLGLDTEPDLTDFDFIDEAPILPPGCGYLPKRDGTVELVHNAVGNLTLPPIEDREYWTYLWEQHGIMIKWNPTARESRFVPLDFGNRLELERQMRRLNTLHDQGKMFQRMLVVRNVGSTSLDAVVRVTTSQT